MKKKSLLYKLFFYWLPVVFWMGIIFYLSSHQRFSLTKTFTYDFIFFKIGHILEYVILNFLLFRSIYASTKKLSVNKILFLSFIISFLYSVSDEYHQLFTPSREGRLRDVGIDTIGIFLMYIYIKTNLKKLVKLL